MLNHSCIYIDQRSTILVLYNSTFTSPLLHYIKTKKLITKGLLLQKGNNVVALSTFNFGLSIMVILKRGYFGRFYLT